MINFDDIVTATGLLTRGTARDPLDPERVLGLLEERYLLSGTLERLMTEKDDTFRLKTEQGTYLVKVASAAEPPELIELQLGAMRHIAATDTDIPVQRVVTDVDGADCLRLDTAQGVRTLRVVTYIEGALLAECEPTRTLMSSVGEMLGRVTLALADFSRSNDTRLLLWDLRHLEHMRALLPYAANQRRRELVEEAFERFYARVVPVLEDLPRQVVHYDFSPFNLLVGGAGLDEVVGVLDFGDVVRTATVFDLAVPVSNFLGRDTERPWEHGGWIVEGYLRRISLPDRLLPALADSATARLALRALVTDWHAHQSEAHHQYMLGHARDDWGHLERALDTAPPPWAHG